ncbi:phenylacetic acid degradation bifunctional protein PaaZ [Aureimonas populi]|uniref:Phenylacetic acid degradation bifunctional protein PaaZ n=1 Tax=Aureimonas populi TaxID=1701758 RepID=A0ABW5CHI1_9HYPH|nr:phenylacetic acid degradation bifunctional protein PaaZ [Aureimonas populi]
MVVTLQSYALGRWVGAGEGLVDIHSAVDGRVVARASSAGLDFEAMAVHARKVGGAALRAMTFHQRAERLKSLAQHLTAHKPALYELAGDTGATKRDNFVDIDGGIGTLFAYSSRGRRELPDEKLIVDGPVETLSKGGSFSGLHILTPLEGVAVHINAFNFPCWGMLEKFAPAILAGVPVIAKPATVTAYVAEAVARLIVESGLLPDGAFQFIAGSTGDLLDHLGGQDIVSFTGSAATAARLRAHKGLMERSVRFVAEQDSLNAALLGPDAQPGTPEFDLFVREVVNEMTAKTGQKCTAIRRILVPSGVEEAAISALCEKLSRVRMGDPRGGEKVMGPLVGLEQREDVRRQVAKLREEADIVFGDPDHCTADGVDTQKGAFMGPVLLKARDPKSAAHVHVTEAFGPVATLMAYEGLADAIDLVRKGEGSLVASLYTHDDGVAQEAILGIAPYHGRLHVLDRDCAGESTGHGSPLPMLVHGGPGRAGGGEELGGLRGVFHYMQRTAIQGSPARLAALTRSWVRGARTETQGEHPFRHDFETLAVGDTVETPRRRITLADIEHFADFTGDRFYAHMDEEAASANPFFPGRVAHGYLILSFAAGLFVDPAPGPLLANYGLDNLRFLKPVSPGDDIRVRLTVKNKRPAREPDYGEVRWDVEIFNQEDETVARYDLLTMSARPTAH